MFKYARHRLFVILITPVLLLPFVTSSPSRAEGDASTGVTYAPDRLIVEYKPGFVATTVQSIESAAVVEALDGINAQVVHVSPDRLSEAYNQFQRDPNVASVSYDVITQIASEPNDPYLVGGTQWAPAKLSATGAWDVVTGDGVVIAIVDSGVDPNHPDLRDRLVPGYNIYDSNTDTSDGCGHGTHVAGIAAATGNNGEGIAGIAYTARIMPVKVINNTCGGSYSRLISGILYAADHGARIIVVTSGATVDNSGLHNAVAYAHNMGAIVVAAAGNNSSDIPFYPASYSETFAVAGTDQNDGRYAYSNYGSQIDVSAPASNIYSTYWSITAGSTYIYMGGTSMAAPHVGGLAALLLARNSGLPVLELEQLILANADDLGDPGWDRYFGAGRVNALRAVTAAGGAAPTPTPLPPTPTLVPPTPTPTVVPPTATPEPPAPTPTATLPEPTPTAEPPASTATSEPPTLTPAPTATPVATVASLHVGGASVQYTRYWRYWKATAKVQVANMQGSAVKGAKVYATWSGAYAASVQCTTDSNGRCSLTTNRIAYNGAALTFAVGNISHTTLVYDPNANTAETQITGITPQSEPAVALAAVVQGDAVNLSWPAPALANTQGFVLYRSQSANPDEAQRITDQVLAVQTTGDAQYSYIDHAVVAGATYTYWLLVVESGEETALLGSTTAAMIQWRDDAVYLPMISSR